MSQHSISETISIKSGIPHLRTLEDETTGSAQFRFNRKTRKVSCQTTGFAHKPDIYCQPKDLAETLGAETVTGLYWHHGQAALVIITNSGRRIGIPKITLTYLPTARKPDLSQGPDLSAHDFTLHQSSLELVSRIIRNRRPN